MRNLKSMWSAKIHLSSLRSTCIERYGGKYNCCGESKDSFLQIDHINNDGYLHRESPEVKRLGLFRWLIKNGFPSGFQILCANCNSSKRILHGFCEHELDKPLDIEGLLVPVDEGD